MHQLLSRAFVNGHWRGGACTKMLRSSMLRCRRPRFRSPVAPLRRVPKTGFDAPTVATLEVGSEWMECDGSHGWRRRRSTPEIALSRCAALSIFHTHPPVVTPQAVCAPTSIVSPQRRYPDCPRDEAVLEPGSCHFQTLECWSLVRYIYIYSNITSTHLLTWHHQVEGIH